MGSVIVVDLGHFLARQATFPDRQQFVEVRFDRVLEDLTDVVRSYVEVLLDLRDLSPIVLHLLVTSAKIAEIAVLAAVEHTVLTNLPECQSSDGVDSNVIDHHTLDVLTHFDHRPLLIPSDPPPPTHPNYQMHGLNHRNEIYSISEPYVHKFNQILPDLGLDAEDLTEVEIFKIVFLLEASRVYSIGRHILD
jgi:hypothetical protein